jgi:predicted permease
MMGWSTLWSFTHDVRYGFRLMRKSPGFTVVAVLTIALGVGVNAGMFSIFNGAALRPLPLPEPGQLVSMYQIFHGHNNRGVHGSLSMFSYREYAEYRDQNSVLAGLVAYAPFISASLGGEHPRELNGQLASCNYFDVLRVRPQLGRGFVGAECSIPGANPVAVLSDSLWRTIYGADPAIVGRTIILNRALFTVIGIAPADFHGTEIIPADFWAPLTMQATLDPGMDLLANDDLSWLVLLGRLKPGVPVEQARADLGVIAARIAQRQPGRHITLSIERAALFSLPEARTVVLAAGTVIMAAVGLVLLIACANVANLLLARAARRPREIALRLAMGAGRGRLIRQLLTESLMISLLGGTLGSLLAFWSFQGMLRYLLAHLPHGVPRLAMNAAPDYRVLLYAFAMTLITGLVCGLAPALVSSRTDLVTALKDQSFVLSGRRVGLLRRVLVGSQVWVCVILLIAAGLLLRGLWYAQRVDPGFETENIARISFDLEANGYTPEKAAIFQRQLRERVAALPGVDATAQARISPLSGSRMESPFRIGESAGYNMAEFNYVSAGYLSLIGVPMVRGRDFSETEVRAGANVAIVTESTARRFWPGTDPIGKTIQQLDGPTLEIIGIAKDAQVSRLGESGLTYLYLPAGPKEQMRLALLAHSARSAGALSKAIIETAQALDSQLVIRVEQLEESLETWRGLSRIVVALSGTLAGLALILASLGVYGMVSYAVSGRTREIGIRMTLGASRESVLKLVLGQALRPVAVGAALGIGGAAAAAQILTSLLFGISPLDPLAYVVAPLSLLAVSLLAAYIPARRAARLNPMITLRYE